MSKQNNLVLICTDQQRYDSLGCCGNPYAVTPNLDALAREATVFHRHIVANPVCMPSRASLLTGRYPNGHGVWINGVPLPRKDYVVYNPECSEIARRLYGCEIVAHVPTLADILREAGYQTAAVGKLHLTPYRALTPPGFEESLERWKDPEMKEWHGPYYGFEWVELTLGHGEGVQGHYRFWLQENFPEIVEALRSGDHRRKLPFPQVSDLYASIIPEEAHHSTWVAQRARDFLERLRDPSRPFFLFVGFPDPHHPFTPPAKLAEQFSRRPYLPPRRDETEKQTKPQGLVHLMRSGDPSFRAWELPDECLALIRRYTDAMVHLIDKAVGQILDTLKRLGLWEKTAVIFTSDHGDFLGDHGLLRKETLCSDCLTHVPFLLRFPGGDFPPETRTPMSNADVLPTLCDLLGIPVPEGVQGQSILPSLKDPQSHPILVICYHTDPRYHNFTVYDQRFRFTWYPATGERELYDHEADPHELHNLRDDPAYRGVEKRLYETLLELVIRTDNPVGGRVALW